MLVNYLVNDLPAKNWYARKASFARSSVKGVESACCMVHCTLQGCTKYPMSKELKEIKIAIIQSNISYVEGVESPFDL